MLGVIALLGLGLAAFLMRPEPDPALPVTPVAAAEGRPNVLMIVIDDLNAWVGHLDVYEPAITPNIDRIAAEGVSFSHAYAAAPECKPSRLSVFTGHRPHHTGVYDNRDGWLSGIFPQQYNYLPDYFSAYGYRTLATGKLLHDFRNNAEYYDETFTGSPNRLPDSRNNGIDTLPRNFDWGPGDLPESDMADFERVDWAVKQLLQPQDEPFFMAVGIVKPHLPWVVPRAYFDRAAELAATIPPGYLPDDLADVPPAGLAEGIKGDHEKIVGAGKWVEAITAYLATILYADAAVGRLWDALQQSEYRDNTIVILWSDHGWQLGEKERWRKFALWSAASRVPYIIAQPAGNKGVICDVPVDLTTVYPTLLELAGLPPSSAADGISVVPLLQNCSRDWPHAAITTSGRNNHAVRYGPWSYMRHANGDEQLYNLDADPWEWHNLATNEEALGPEFQELRSLLPCDVDWFPGRSDCKD